MADPSDRTDRSDRDAVVVFGVLVVGAAVFVASIVVETKRLGEEAFEAMPPRAPPPTGFPVLAFAFGADGDARARCAAFDDAGRVPPLETGETFRVQSLPAARGAAFALSRLPAVDRRYAYVKIIRDDDGGAQLIEAGCARTEDGMADARYEVAADDVVTPIAWRRGHGQALVFRAFFHAGAVAAVVVAVTVAVVQLRRRRRRL